MQLAGGGGAGEGEGVGEGEGGGGLSAARGFRGLINAWKSEGWKVCVLHKGSRGVCNFELKRLALHGACSGGKREGGREAQVAGCEL